MWVNAVRGFNHISLGCEEIAAFSLKKSLLNSDCKIKQF